MAKTHAPYFKQIRDLIKERTNPNAVITSTSHHLLYEVRQPIEIQVPYIQKTDKYIATKKATWTTKPGDILMPFWTKVEDPAQRLFILQLELGISTRHVRKVMKSSDIFKVFRQRARHILDYLIKKRETIRQQSIQMAGEYDKLMVVLDMLGKINNDTKNPDEMVQMAEKYFGNVRNYWKVQAKEALEKGQIQEAAENIAMRMDEVLAQAEGILRQVKEIRRIIWKIEYGFDTAYMHLNQDILNLQKPHPNLEKVAEDARQTFHYLTWKVAAFAPFYGWGHSQEVMALQRVPQHLSEGHLQTAINILTRAASSIEKGVKGIRPEAKEILRVRRRVLRRLQ